MWRHCAAAAPCAGASGGMPNPARIGKFIQPIKKERSVGARDGAQVHDTRGCVWVQRRSDNSGFGSGRAADADCRRLFHRSGAGGRLRDLPRSDQISTQNKRHAARIKYPPTPPAVPPTVLINPTTLEPRPIYGVGVVDGARGRRRGRGGGRGGRNQVVSTLPSDCPRWVRCSARYAVLSGGRSANA